MPPDPVFDKALKFLLLHEGTKFTDNPADPGGATKFGISLRELHALGHLDGLDLDINHDDHVDVTDVQLIDAAFAAEFYRRVYWDKYGYGRIRDDRVAAKLFDLAVNMGPGQAARIAQRAIRAAWFPMSEDGTLGAATLSSLNAAPPQALLAALNSEAAGFYRWLAAVKPASATFLAGWLNRAYSKL